MAKSGAGWAELIRGKNSISVVLDSSGHQSWLLSLSFRLSEGVSGLSFGCRGVVPGEDLESGGSGPLLCVIQAVADPPCALAFVQGFSLL